MENSLFSQQSISPVTTLDYNAALSTPESARKQIFRKYKGNIRKNHLKERIDEKRKTLMNLGKEYTSRGGKRPAKTMIFFCNLTCRTKCSTKINNEEGKTIFDKFWSLGDWNKQWGF